MPGQDSKVQLGIVGEDNKLDHGRDEGAKAKSLNPKASGFKEVKPEIGGSLKDMDSMNAMGPSKGNPGGM